jgi:murein L,D-transpeptidase YcbB/YkuD
MSAREMLSVVGTAVGGLIGWTGGAAPSADPASLRALFADLGLPTDDLDCTVRRFQSRVGLRPDGVAGARTVHQLVRYAEQARELHGFEHSLAA